MAAKKAGKTGDAASLSGCLSSTYLVSVIFPVKGESKRQYVVLLVVRTAVVEDVLCRDPLPGGPRRGLDQWTHAISKQALGLAVVHDVEDHSLHGMGWDVVLQLVVMVLEPAIG